MSDPANGVAMHFDPNPVCPVVMTKATKHVAKVFTVHKTDNKQHKHSGKSSTVRYVSFDLMIMPSLGGFRYVEPSRLVHASPLPENYSFLFYREINPPPPKSC